MVVRAGGAAVGVQVYRNRSVPASRRGMQVKGSGRELYRARSPGRAEDHDIRMQEKSAERCKRMGGRGRRGA
jgi:hypothetical protein